MVIKQPQLEKKYSTDKNGRYGIFGGRYVPETLMHAVLELEQGFKEAMDDPLFLNDYQRILHEYSGRPTPVTFCKRLSNQIGGARIFLKREDLNHTGAHKINNAVGQALLARRMGKKKIIAETGAGQHGVASATVAAYLGMPCKVFMGAVDVKRQSLNVFRMKLLGAEVVPVHSGNGTLKDAVNEVLRYWAANVEDTAYIDGSVVGPHPYPMIVRDFQRIIGDEARTQMIDKLGRLPDAAFACVGGGSNAMGLFTAFINDPVQLFGAEAGGIGIDTDAHAATLTKGSIGIVHGMKTYLLQDRNGQITEPYSISAGLDYPGIGPEHAYLCQSRRVTYEAITDDEAVDALIKLSKLEGILPALESAHGLALAMKKAKAMKPDQNILVCLSGRGDKDVHTILHVMDEKNGGDHR
ncbi:tryptophan synthase subunit beta [Sporolactobacillus shoreicorticis]|uniref:Tryptophan synthase beta chain n=1 Tax=Sporolactobacillus shoreicorticis TaxID=1923877 RepID=A0ABW5S0M2_9BACL|nr:tryptophan synthase subunit beta [Sporolactobacillus shoreicorticis]MCO7127028.1 tryptophan synthase subunit beta [Sporolactobacillus shoreicorticis]